MRFALRVLHLSMDTVRSVGRVPDQAWCDDSGIHAWQANNGPKSGSRASLHLALPPTDRQRIRDQRRCYYIRGLRGLLVCNLQKGIGRVEDRMRFGFRIRHGCKHSAELEAEKETGEAGRRGAKGNNQRCKSEQEGYLHYRGP